MPAHKLIFFKSGCANASGVRHAKAERMEILPMQDDYFSDKRYAAIGVFTKPHKEDANVKYRLALSRLSGSLSFGDYNPSSPYGKSTTTHHHFFISACFFSQRP